MFYNKNDDKTSQNEKACRKVTQGSLRDMSNPPVEPRASQTRGVKVPYALNGKEVGFPHDAARDVPWACPECKGPVIVKRGRVLTPHFAHKASESSCSGGGESVQHYGTKHWIAKHINDPKLRIEATCRDCRRLFTAFHGSSSYQGHTEVWLNRPATDARYRVDVVATKGGPRGDRIVANIEVKYKNPTTDDKMAELAAQSYNAAFEVPSVNLVTDRYPLVYQSIRKRCCRPCARLSLRKRCARAEHGRLLAGIRVAGKWKRGAAILRSRRHEKELRRWYLLYLLRSKTMGAKTASLHAAEEAERIPPCTKCTEPVVMYTWDTYRVDGERCNRSRKRWDFQSVCADFTRINGKIYHDACAPECPTCHEDRTEGKWCACERAKHRPCADCKRWVLKEGAHEFTVPQRESHSQKGYVCTECKVHCLTCRNPISKAQAKFGGKCYLCNQRGKTINVWFGDSHQGLCATDGCRVKIDPQYTVCYSCKINPL
jgi:hypothetical protein